MDSKFKSNIEQINRKNSLILKASSLIGTGIGVVSNIDDGLSSTMVGMGIVGGITGVGLSKLLMTDPDDYTNKVLFGPYSHKIHSILIELNDIIEYISIKDSKYKEEYDTIINKPIYINIKKDSDISKTRLEYVNLLNNIMTIIDKYIKSKKPERQVIEYYQHEVMPGCKLIQKYLIDSKILLDNNSKGTIMLNKI